MTIELVMKAVEGIEKKIGDYSRNTELKMRELSEEMMQLKQGAAIRFSDFQPSNKTLGNQVFAELEKNRDLLGKTQGLRFEIKAAADAVTSASAATVASGGIGGPGMPTIGVQNGFKIRPANGVNTRIYSRYTGIEGNAGVQAGEGAEKAAMRPTFTEITQAAITIAAHTVVSRQALNDSAELNAVIEAVLRRDIANKLDNVLIDGSTTPTWAGLEALATAYTSLAYPLLADTASEGVSLLQTNGHNPTTMVMTPASWLQVQTSRSYIGSDPADDYLRPLHETLRGHKICLSNHVAPGKVLVFDNLNVELAICEEMTVTIGFINDQFTRNLATVLCEMRVIPIFRSVGAAYLMTPKA